MSVSRGLIEDASAGRFFARTPMHSILEVCDGISTIAEDAGAAYQRQWLDSPEPQDPGAPEGQRYGYGISLMTFGPNHVYFRGGEMPGYNSFMGYDPVNDITLIIWTSLTVSLDGQPRPTLSC